MHGRARWSGGPGSPRTPAPASAGPPSPGPPVARRQGLRAARARACRGRRRRMHAVLHVHSDASLRTCNCAARVLHTHCGSSTRCALCDAFHACVQSAWYARFGSASVSNTVSRNRDLLFACIIAKAESSGRAHTGEHLKRLRRERPFCFPLAPAAAAAAAAAILRFNRLAHKGRDEARAYAAACHVSVRCSAGTCGMHTAD